MHGSTREIPDVHTNKPLHHRISDNLWRRVVVETELCTPFSLFLKFLSSFLSVYVMRTGWSGLFTDNPIKRWMSHLVNSFRCALQLMNAEGERKNSESEFINPFWCADRQMRLISVWVSFSSFTCFVLSTAHRPSRRTMKEIHLCFGEADNNKGGTSAPLLLYSSQTVDGQNKGLAGETGNYSKNNFASCNGGLYVIANYQ